MIAVLIGLVFILIGGFGILHWAGDFLLVLRGFIPLSLFVGGIVSLIAGIASFRTVPKDDRNKE